MSLDHLREAAAAGTPALQQRTGNVLSVQGAQATIGILPGPGKLPDDRATVGNFVAIASGQSVLIGFITETSIELPGEARAQGYIASAHLDLMGEIKNDGHGRAAFQRGVTVYPRIGDPAVAIGEHELRVVYGTGGNETIKVGQLQQNGRLDAYIHIDDMLSRHFAVFGTSGVGKSSGVVLLLREILKSRPNLRIFLLDTHNEYARCFSDRAHVLNPANLKLPFWLFNFEEMVDVIFGARPGVEEETEILAEVIPIAKAMYMQYQASPDRPGLKRTDPKSTGFTADTPVPYRLADLLTLIDERMGKLENRSSRMKYQKLVMRIESVSNDPRYTFMFENANVGGDTMVEVLCQLFRLPPNGKPMTIMQLAGFPAEVVDSVVSVLGRMAFEFGLWSEGAFPQLFVCEEAHRYASADRSLGFGPTRRALSRISKEGRKYGLFLGLVSQRPAELDPTIISQCSTLFVMRMSNDRDQAIIRSAVSDAAANLLRFVPSLGTREVLAFGEGVALPARLIFDSLPQDVVPNSEAVRNTHSAADEKVPENFIESVVARWRGAHLNFKQPPPLDAHSTAPRQDAPCLQPAGPRTDRFSILKKKIDLETERTKPRRVVVDDPDRWPA
ncbi:MAG TPA: DUF87 domain-containing protein [Xanthobacteraceae bacterium]|nr:DUF87 domain-containing protein [Xanthobacteraceae bacterium]